MNPNRKPKTGAPARRRMWNFYTFTARIPAKLMKQVEQQATKEKGWATLLAANLLPRWLTQRALVRQVVINYGLRGRVCWLVLGRRLNCWQHFDAIKAGVTLTAAPR